MPHAREPRPENELETVQAMVHREDVTTDTQVDKNIAMAFDWLQSVIDDPSVLDQVPNHASIIFLPQDDPEQFEANLAMAMDAARRGKNVYLKQVVS
jgi:hypothetical protein